MLSRGENGFSSGLWWCEVEQLMWLCLSRPISRPGCSALLVFSEDTTGQLLKLPY